MASITISQLDETTLERLRTRANEHGRTVEEEATEIVKRAVSVPRADNLYDAIRRRVEPLGGFELPEIVRELDRTHRGRGSHRDCEESGFCAAGRQPVRCNSAAGRTSWRLRTPRDCTRT